MPFAKLEERSPHGVVEYFVRTDTIKEVDVEKTDQGRVVKLCVILEGELSDNEGGLEFEFSGGDAETNYNNLAPVLKAF